MSQQRKIAIVMGSHWQRRMGGAQYQAKCIVETLLKHGGWTIAYLASLTDPQFAPSGYRIHTIGNNRRLSRFGGFLADTPRLIRCLDEIEPDVVYQRGLKAYTGIIASWCRRKNCRFIFHVAHDDDVSRQSTGRLLGHSLNKLIDKRVGEYGIKHADAVVAQTALQADLLSRNFDVQAALIAPNFHPYPDSVPVKDPHPIRVLWVANFKKMKRPELFVELAESLRDDYRFEFRMIGRPGDPARYEELIDTIATMPNLTYLGEQPIEVVNRELERSHFFVNTSESEGFPNTFIQAWMREVPVLSLDIDPDGVLSHEDIGLCCGTVAQMRSALSKLAGDPGRRTEMGLRARHWAELRHGPAAADRIEQLFAQQADLNRKIQSKN